MESETIHTMHRVKLEESTTNVGPILAKRLLEGNKLNRDFRASHARKIARQMKLGRWKASPEPIVITSKGRLINGQHRLWAVIETGTTQEFTISEIPDEKYPEIFEILDQGATRSPSDVLREDSKNLKPINYLLRVAGLVKVEPQDLRPFLDSKLGHIVRKINDRKPTGKIWKHNLFKAAMAVSILDDVISEEEAFTTYDTLLSNTITQWPNIYGQLYMQLTDTTMPLNYSGRSVNNDWFIRPMFAIKHRHNSNIKMIRIYKSFQHQTEAAVVRVLTKINPYFLE